MSHKLKVAREDLRTALKPIVRAFKPSEVGSIVLSFADGRLLMDAGNVGTSVVAEGEWSCPVTVSYRGHFMRAMKHLPKVPFLYITADGNSLSIGGKIIQCKRIETSK